MISFQTESAFTVSAVHQPCLGDMPITSLHAEPAALRSR